MTLLVKNVRVLGGEKKFPDAVDVFVSGEKISAIGNFPGKSADTVIEGNGAYLSPGFIDVDTESDHYLSIFTNPGQEDFLKQGVTTIVGGLCGASLAPLIYGSLESIADWTKVAQVNVDWRSMKEFFDVVGRMSLGINFSTFTGHSTIRQALIGQKPRNLTKNEILVFSQLLKKSLDEGAMGMSTGLGFAQNRETAYGELKALAAIVAEAGGVYATHLRDEKEDLLGSFDEAVRLAKETKVKFLISHLLPVQGHEGDYEKALEQIKNLPADLDFHFSLYTSTTRILKLYTFLPIWAQKDDLDVMTLSLEDEWMRQKITKDLPKVDPKKFMVAQAPGNDSLVGASLFDLKQIFSLKNYEETLIKLMRTTRLRAIVFYENINSELLRSAIKNPRSIIASNAASIKENKQVLTLKPERSVSTFPNLIKMALSEKIIDIEEAIQKITVLPAKMMGLEKRGVVAEGNFADLTVFKETGISHVILNGKTVIKDGEFQNVLAGKIIKKIK